MDYRKKNKQERKLQLKVLDCDTSANCLTIPCVAYLRESIGNQ